MDTASRLLLQKLGLKEGKTAVFVHVPAEVQAFPQSHKTLEKGHDIIIAFYECSKQMKLELPQLKVAIKPTGMIWVGWKKGRVSDVSRDLIWQLGEECGLSSVASVAIDDVWVAMKLMYPRNLRQRAQART